MGPGAVGTDKKPASQWPGICQNNPLANYPFQKKIKKAVAVSDLVS